MVDEYQNEKSPIFDSQKGTKTRSEKKTPKNESHKGLQS